MHGQPTTKPLHVPQTVTAPYLPAYRERVLRRLADTGDLEGTARDFGVPKELVVQWQHARARGRETSRSTMVGLAPTSVDALSWWAALMAGIGAPTLIVVMAGPIHPSAAAWRLCIPPSILLGLGMFVGLFRLAGPMFDLSGHRRLVLAAIHAACSAVSAWIFTMALPAIPHRLIGTPVEVHTVVMDKVVRHIGKNTLYCLVLPPFDPRTDANEWCTRKDRYEQAKVGQALVLHGTTSWFGFKQDDFDLVIGRPVETLASSNSLQPSPVLPAMLAAESKPPLCGQPTRLVMPVQARQPLHAMAANDAATCLDRDPLHAWPGDDLAAIEAVYPNAPAPTPYLSVNTSNRQVVRLPDRGLSFFLDASGRINEIRIERPFAAAVDGVHLGDRIDAVEHALGSTGQAVATAPAPFPRTVFSSKARYTIRVELDEDRYARMISLVR